ncbi:MAG: hypothetical protein QG656_548 [Candidatus Hydrogenedentes bacterium]|nr:hypothetical protein [Candidatus Hydrogenedentota bacterium]
MSTVVVPIAQPEQQEESIAGPQPVEVSRTVVPVSPRYRNPIGKFSVRRDSSCIACGKCARICPYEVHKRPGSYRLPIRPFDYRCIGPECEKTDHFCITNCPVGALSLTSNPVFESMGDYRWTPDLLASIWAMAETGHRPPAHLECETGNSGGGFDKLRFLVPESAPKDLRR